MLKTYSEFIDSHRINGRAEPFAPAFLAFLDALIAEVNTGIELRVCAWLLRNAWGRMSDSVVDENGNSRPQADCARDLNLFRTVNGKHEPDRQRVNKVIRALEKHGYVECRGQEIILKSDPRGIFASSSPNVEKVSTFEPDSPDFRRYIEQVWGSANPEEFAKLQAAENEVKRIRTSILNGFKAWKQTLLPFQHSSEEQGCEGSNTALERSQHPVASVATNPTASLEALEVKKLASCAERIENVVAESGLRVKLQELDAHTARNAAKRIEVLVPPERVDEVFTELGYACQKVAQRKTGKPDSWGILVRLVEDAIATVRNRAEAPPPAKPVAMEVDTSWRREWEQLLEDSTASEEDKARARKMLGIAAKGASA